MDEEELFCKLFPEYVVNGKPLSPYFDLFESGYEQSEKRIEELKAENEKIKNSDTLCKLIGEQKIKIAELEAQVEGMKSDVVRCFGDEFNILVAKLLKEWEIK